MSVRQRIEREAKIIGARRCMVLFLIVRNGFGIESKSMLDYGKYYDIIYSK